jgi:cytochrome c oxidase subunit 2
MSFVLLGLALLAAEPAPRADAPASWPARLATQAEPAPPERVVHLTARRFTYSPETIEVEEGVPVVLELTSLDRDHGFTVPELGLRIDVEPGKTARVRFVPEKAGTFLFHCDIFCGTGHEEMAGQIVVAKRKEAGGGS